MYLKQVNLGHFSKAIYQTNYFYRFIYLFIYLSFQSSLRPRRRCVRLAHLQRHLRAGQRPVRVQVNQHALVYDFPIFAFDYLIVFLLIHPDFFLIYLSNYLSIYLPIYIISVYSSNYFFYLSKIYGVWFWKEASLLPDRVGCPAAPWPAPHLATGMKHLSPSLLSIIYI